MEWERSRNVLRRNERLGKAPAPNGVESEIFQELLADPGALAPFVAVGFVAQLIDGALGMAFGVISNTLLISFGVPPAAASASVHVIKNFTGAVSAVSHVAHRNVEWRLFWRLLVPGIAGGVLGAYLLSAIDPDIAKPLVLAYLASIGLYLLYRALRAPPTEKHPRIVEPLGAAGGFLDATGGGGWGPIVTSNLIVQGANPRLVVGTVNTSELFVALSITGAFFLSLGLDQFGREAAGLLIGGVAAAPLGGYVAKRVNARMMIILVGVVLTLSSLFALLTAIA